MPIIVGKKRQATGASAQRLSTARVRARISAIPPGGSTAAEYEQLVSDERDYSVDGQYRTKLQFPKYDVKKWSYVETQSGTLVQSTATRWYIKYTHEPSLLPSDEDVANEIVRGVTIARSPAQKKSSSQETLRRKVQPKKTSPKKGGAKKLD